VNLDFDERLEEFHAEATGWLARHVPAPPLPSVDTGAGDGGAACG
jgi:hypothetical protein